jgi:hypothetical protein
VDPTCACAGIFARRCAADVLSVSLRHTFIAFCALLVTLLAPGRALAVGGNYAFDGGTALEQAQVRAALDVSAFDWSLVPARITIHIRHGLDSEATRGDIWLDADLVDSGQFAWATIQHEYAHQVDYFLLGEAERSSLTHTIGAATWWPDGTHPHAALGCERFASTLAWAYWPTHANALRPASRRDEAGAVPPAQFRALVAQLLGFRTLAFHH